MKRLVPKTLNLGLLGRACATGFLLSALTVHAQALPGQALPGQDHAGDTTHAQQLAWWKNQRFGMFIHWGPVAQRGQEISWSRGGGIPTAEYDSLYKTFNPTGYNAGEWVRIAQSAGMKYMVLVTKHHDGFCEFNTKLTPYNIMSPNSPFRRDIVKEMADSAHKMGMGLGLYYSPTDWYVHPSQDTTPYSSEYLTQYTNQVVDELLTNYGRVETVWWDGSSIGADPQALLKRMQQKQPWILVNGRGDHGSVSDYGTPEQTIGAFDTLHAWESCMTIDGGGQWAWNPTGGVKPLRALIDMIVGTADGGGNCLLNVGPRPDGIIDPLQVGRLKEIGQWMDKYGQSIYGTTGGYIPSGSWGGSTHKGDTVYLHLKKFNGTVTIPPLNSTIMSTASLTGGTPVVEQTQFNLRITLPLQNIDSLYTILKIIVNPNKPFITFKNVAIGGTATQSSLAFAGTPDRAIDGNTDGNFSSNSVTHTDNSAGAWWMVDLLNDYAITAVNIFNRSESVDRLSDYNVILLDNNQTLVWTSHQTSAPSPNTLIDAGGRTARFVKVELTGTNYLSLAEVQVLVNIPTIIRSKAGLTRIKSASGSRLNRNPTPIFRKAESNQNFDLSGGRVRSRIVTDKDLAPNKAK